MREQDTRNWVPGARERRNDQTPAEQRLWFEFLRTQAMKFRRQVPFSGCSLDCSAPALKLCIELDGRTLDGHAAQEYDAERTKILAAGGIQVIQSRNAHVMNTFHPSVKPSPPFAPRRLPAKGSRLRGDLASASLRPYA